jgi:hypothetical protein
VRLVLGVELPDEVADQVLADLKVARNRRDQVMLVIAQTDQVPLDVLAVKEVEPR